MSTKLIKGLERRFLELVGVSFQNLCEAARVYVELIKADPTARARMIADHGLTPRFLDDVERIGNDNLLPEIFVNAPGLRSLPISEQRRVLKDTVPAVIEQADGSVDMIQVSILGAPVAMQRQLVAGSHIRSISEQRAWLVAKANLELPKDKPAPIPFEATKQGLVVHTPVKFTWPELRRIMKGLSEL